MTNSTTLETTTEASDDFIPFTVEQEMSLAIVPIISAVLSVFGSSKILHLIRKEGKIDCQKRLLIGMSITDIILSVTFSLQSFAPPRDSSPRVWAIGNDQTCKAIGFFHTLGASALWYNQMLCLYYLLSIRFGKKEDTLRKYYEPFMHAWAVGYPLIIAVVGSVLDVYHESKMTPGCWVDPPSHCYGNVTSDPTADDCKLREIQNMRMLLKVYPIPVVFTFVLVSNIVIFRFVQRTTTRWSRRQIAGSFSTDITELQHRRLVQVRNQCLLYVLASWSPLLCSVLLTVANMALGLEREEMHKLFVLFFLQSFFYPLTGLLNLMVYLRPQYITCRGLFPEETLWRLVRRALAGEGTESRNQNRLNAMVENKRRSSRLARINSSAANGTLDEQVNPKKSHKSPEQEDKEESATKSIVPLHPLPPKRLSYEDNEDKDGNHILEHKLDKDDSSGMLADEVSKVDDDHVPNGKQ